MGIILVCHKHNLRTGLVVECDICGKRITEADDANIVWESDDVGCSLPYKVFCKSNGCDMSAQQHARKNCKNSHWQPLGAGVICLIQNIGLWPLQGKKMKQAVETSRGV